MQQHEEFFRDLRYSIAMFRRTPLFTAIAIASLALGIGANAAMFSLIDSLLLQPLPYGNPERLVRLAGTYPRAAVSYFQTRSHVMDVAAASSPKQVNLRVAGVATRVLASGVSANFLAVMGVSPERGSAFQTGDDSPSRDRVALISDSLWQERFGRDPNIVGHVLSVDGKDRQIVGILPAGFAYPSNAVQVWMPLLLDPANFLQFWGDEFVPFIGRMHAGVTLRQATDETSQLTAAFRQTFPYPMSRQWNADPHAIPLQADLVGDVKAEALILMVAVGTLLFIVCANVAGLLLARATTRRKEIALRASLGATRMRMVRQLLTESFALALIGGSFGLLLSVALLSVFKAVLPASIPGVAQATIDWRVTLVVFALAIFSGLAFGLAPALSTSLVDLTETLKTGSQRTTSGFWVRFRSSLIAAEIALTFALVMAAGLLFRTLEAMVNTNVGFQPAHNLVLSIDPNPGVCAQRRACIALYDRILMRVRDLPGVNLAAVTNAAPLDGQLPTIPIDVEDHPKSADHPAPMVWFGAVTAGYFEILQMRLLVGRLTTPNDSEHSTPVAVVSAALTRRLWPGENPIGKRIKLASSSTWRTVVGVVADVHQYSLIQALPDWVFGAVYMPYPQAEQEDGQIPAAMTLLLSSRTNGPQLRNQLRTIVKAEAPDIPVSEVRSLTGFVSSSTAGSRAALRLFAFFAGTAVLLAAIGIYGLMSYWVDQRTYEIGLRVAVGASARQILLMTLGQGLAVCGYGLLAGLAAALALGPLLSSLLYGVKPTDLTTIVAVILVVLVTALIATALPAWAAMRLDAVKALKAD